MKPILFFLATSLCYGQVPLLWDDDVTSDVDVAVTAAAVNKLADQHIINLVAVTADTSNIYAAPSLFIFERYYLRASLSIGAYQGTLSCSTGCNTSAWSGPLVAQYNPGDTRSNYPSCVTTYRQAVSSHPGIVIVMTGMAPCMAGFLASGADSSSPLTGAQLARQNVSKLIVLGGVNPSGTEFNFQSDAPDWNTIFTTWTTQNGYPPVWMVDYNDGLITNAGPPTYASNTVNPELYAFQQAGVNQRPVWDSLAVLLGAYGLSMGSTTLFADAGNGTQTVNAGTGSNNWSTSTASGHHYVTNAASASGFAALLDGYQNTSGYPALPPQVGTGIMAAGPVSVRGPVSIASAPPSPPSGPGVTVGNQAEAQSCATGTTCVLPPFTVSQPGSALYLRAGWCADGGCSTTPPGAMTATDTCGNTYTPVVNHLQATWSQTVMVARNVTAAPCTITLTQGGNTLAYTRWLVVEAVGANQTAPVDSAVSNTANGSGTAVSISSAGNTSVAGELIIADFDVTNPSNASCATLQTDSASYMELTKAPASNTSVTCSLTQASANWWATIVGLRP